MDLVRGMRRVPLVYCLLVKEGFMDASEVLAQGLGVTLPWRLGSQHLDTSKSPHELHLRLESDRGTTYACHECGRSCKAHDFGEFRWRHLNFFQQIGRAHV